jgi:hypothetical protein
MNWLRRLFGRIEEIVLPVIDSPSVRHVAGLLLLGAVFAGLLLSIQRVPEWQAKRASVRSAVVNPEAKTTPADVAALQNEMRKTYLQVVGGAGCPILRFFLAKGGSTTNSSRTDRFFPLISP